MLKNFWNATLITLILPCGPFNNFNLCILWWHWHDVMGQLSVTSAPENLYEVSTHKCSADMETRSWLNQWCGQGLLWPWSWPRWSLFLHCSFTVDGVLSVNIKRITYWHWFWDWPGVETCPTLLTSIIIIILFINVLNNLRLKVQS